MNPGQESSLSFVLLRNSTIMEKHLANKLVEKKKANYSLLPFYIIQSDTPIPHPLCPDGCVGITTGAVIKTLIFIDEICFVLHFSDISPHCGIMA